MRVHDCRRTSLMHCSSTQKCSKHNQAERKGCCRCLAVCGMLQDKHPPTSACVQQSLLSRLKSLQCASQIINVHARFTRAAQHSSPAQQAPPHTTSPRPRWPPAPQRPAQGAALPCPCAQMRPVGQQCLNRSPALHAGPPPAGRCCRDCTSLHFPPLCTAVVQKAHVDCDTRSSVSACNGLQAVCE